MVVVVCDGACGEATTIDLDHSAELGLDAQLQAAGWSCAADGADLCGDCTRREIARAALVAKLATGHRPARGLIAVPQ